MTDEEFISAIDRLRASTRNQAMIDLCDKALEVVRRKPVVAKLARFVTTAERNRYMKEYMKRYRREKKAKTEQMG